jgi:hypothetical protein
MTAPPTSSPLHERSRYRAAADYARRRYPGPVGEVLFLELAAYADLGCSASDEDALVPRLARVVLTPPARRPDTARTTVRGARVAR